MFNTASSSSHIASSTPATATVTATPEETTVTTSAQPTLSSRDPAAPSMLLACLSFHSAAETGDCEAINAAFVTYRGAAINEIHPQTRLTPLQTALRNNHQQAAETLIARGARVHDVQPGCRPEDVSLHAACELGDLDLLAKVLKRSSSDLNARDPVSGWTPLTFALRGNRLDAARMLLEAGAKTHVRNRDGSVPLVFAASGNNIEAVRLLLDHGAHVDQPGGDGMTALRNAVFTGNEKMAGLLLGQGADVNQINMQEQTLLFDAITLREPSMIALLLEHGIDIEHADQCECTALCHAAILGGVEEARVLLARGANQAHAATLPGTPVMIAAASGNMELLELLLTTKNVFIDIRNRTGNTALHLAAKAGHEAAVHLLLLHGASIMPKNMDGDTPLALAARSGHLRAMTGLLDAEQPMVMAEHNAQVILKQAVSQAAFPVVALLLERGVYFDVETRDLAGHPLIAEMLLHAALLKARQAEDPDDTLPLQFDGSVLLEELLAIAIADESAVVWLTCLSKHRVSPTLSFALAFSAANARAVWNSLAGEGQKITLAQQKNWCAGILDDLQNVMLRESPHATSGLPSTTRAVLEKISTAQTHAITTAALAAEQTLRDGMNNLLPTCMKAVSDDQFYPMDLYKVLTWEHGVYHNVASLIVSAFADVWPRRDSLGDVKLEQAFGAKLSSLKANRRTLQALNSGTADTDNQASAIMLVFRQLDLLQAWMDKTGGQ